LGNALPHAQFGEHHARVVDADPDRVWSALHEVRWGDLRLTRPLMAVRLGWRRTAGAPRMVDAGPGAPIHRDPPRTMSSGLVGQPWHAVPRMGPAMASLDDLRDFDEPGWLKFGMEWTLSPLAGGRTLVETVTLCAATDEHSRRRFSAYWTLIRPFSGLIRRELLGVVARAVSEEPGRSG